MSSFRANYIFICRMYSEYECYVILNCFVLFGVMFKVILFYSNTRVRRI